MDTKLKEQPTIYYAHAMSWYGTPGEAGDVAALRVEGYDVLNPNDKDGFYSRQVEAMKARGEFDVMTIFREAVRSCHVLAYRPLTYGPGIVTAGVAVEIMEAHVWNMPIFRLSGGCNAQVCSPVYLTEGLPDWSMVAGISRTRDLIKRGIL
jgi:hypothetical protein